MRISVLFAKISLHGNGPAMRKLLEEIKRRNVFRVAFVYIVAGYVDEAFEVLIILCTLLIDLDTQSIQ